MSYDELDKRANQLAHHLITLGVGPEVPVGVMMLRSLHLFVALLGVLKAGGAYVPMDPDYPPDRLALMLEDSEVSCNHTTVATLPARTPSKPVALLIFKGCCIQSTSSVSAHVWLY